VTEGIITNEIVYIEGTTLNPVGWQMQPFISDIPGCSNFTYEAVTSLTDATVAVQV
jgi:hypothetical protein